MDGKGMEGKDGMVMTGGKMSMTMTVSGKEGAMPDPNQLLVQVKGQMLGTMGRLLIKLK
jgi:hypothetical protein